MKMRLNESGLRKSPRKSLSIRAGLGILGTLFSSLSVVLLIKHGLELKEFSSVVTIVLVYYENLISVCFGWLAPVAGWVLRKITSVFDLNLSLLDYWKHIFVVMWLYFLSSK